jgi:cytochrome c oxidase subunit 3
MPSSVLDRHSPVAGSGGGRPEGRLPRDEREGGGGGILGDPRRFGLLAFLGTVSMLFVGFTSAYIVRRAAADWRPLSPPALLWANTAFLLASSVSLQTARARLRGWDLEGLRTWIALTGALGTLFVVGQLLAWRSLSAQGIFLASNPHSSFFYLLTGLHMIHLLGALVWYGVVARKVHRMAYTPGEDGLALFATYWHFLAGLWLYLLFLLFVL